MDSVQAWVGHLNTHYLPEGDTSSSGQSQPEDLRLKYEQLKTTAEEVFKLYAEGLKNLKKYKLHPKLQSDGKKCLIDIYYKEEQMNSFRDTL